jgi:trans-aconitate methyltransferase
LTNGCDLADHVCTWQKRTAAKQVVWSGVAYERLMGRWSQPVGEAFIDWLDVPKGMRWLDVGCGNGAFTEVLVKRCAPASVAAIRRAPSRARRVRQALQRNLARRPPR